MDELTEIRLNNGVLILDKHRVMSPIIPQGYKDIDNDILVKGTAQLEGAVYTRKFDIETGPLTVCGPVFAKASLSSHTANEQSLTFKKAVASSGRIDLFDAGKKLFGADVNGAIVRLKNAVVAANVFASEVELEDCVVLGGVFATKALRLRKCVDGTFNAPSVVIDGDIYVLFPSVFTVEPLNVDKGSRLFCITLADWGNLIKGLPENEMSGMVEIDPANDGQKISLQDKQGNQTMWQTYSVAGKVLAADLLDLKKLDNHFMLSVGSFCEQLVKQYELGCDKEGKPVKLTLETLGQFFRDIQSGKIKVRELDAKVSFDELKKFYAD